MTLSRIIYDGLQMTISLLLHGLKVNFQVICLVVYTRFRNFCLNKEGVWKRLKTKDGVPAWLESYPEL